MTSQSLGFIGGGRVTTFLLDRLNKTNALPHEVIIADPDSSRHALLTAINERRIRCTIDPVDAARSNAVFIAVHPPAASEVCGSIKSLLKKDTVLFSFMPAITIHRLSEMLDGFNRIIRMIPNAPSVIGKGYNPVVFSSVLTADEKDAIRSLCAHWGETPEVPEAHLEAYAVLSGMGPTYFWFQWLELVRLGTTFGMSEAESKSAAAATLRGAVDTLFHSGLPDEQVLNLIPAYPLKNHEEEFKRIFSERLTGLWKKLRDSTR